MLWPRRRESCATACRAILGSDADNDVKRCALDALVRYATPIGAQRLGQWRTAGVAALDGVKPERGQIHGEHVLPVRVMVDRMMSGDEPAAVLEVSVVAHVLAVEHSSIGPLVKRHADLYERMKVAPLAELPELALERYRATGLELVSIEVETALEDRGGIA